MKTTTTAMQQYDVPAEPDAVRHGATSAGLVLLYSDAYLQMAPVYPLRTHRVLLGREEGCDILVPQRAVSRNHAVIEFRDGNWWLSDLGGPNGTILNGSFVSQARLEHLDELRVGDSIFKFVASGAESFAPYRIDGARMGSAAVKSVDPDFIGGMQIQQILDQIERVARADLSVVIQGESGTGKEVIANKIHQLSGRKGAFQAVNCAAIPDNLIESELFGFVRGAFSGADRNKQGLITSANHGTLLLDEIGDMPLQAQAKLLRVIQSREVFPVGATSGQRVDVRFVCASNRDLSRMVREGRFRGDLLARLNEFSVWLPSLRERKEDIFMLANSLLRRHGFNDYEMTFPFLLALFHHDWPYNVRELEACMKRAAVVSTGNVLQPEHLPDAVRESMAGYGRRADGTAPAYGVSVAAPAPAQAAGLHATMPSTNVPSAPPPVAQPPAQAGKPSRSVAPSEEYLRSLLEQYKGNVAAVGRALGKERMQVHRWMRRYGIVVDDYRRS